MCGALGVTPTTLHFLRVNAQIRNLDLAKTRARLQNVTTHRGGQTFRWTKLHLDKITLTLDLRQKTHMTFDIRNIWTSTNKMLTTINLYFLAFVQSGMTTPVKVKDASDIKKIPFIYNILLLIVLTTISSIFIYILFGGRLTIS